MKRKRMFTAGLVLLLCLTLTIETDAFLGVGDVVYDPSVYGQAVAQAVRLEQQYAQLVETYLILRSQYEQLVFSARRVPVNMVARYRAIATPWEFPSSADTYGTSGGWTSAITTGQGVVDRYVQSIEALAPYGPALANVPSNQLARLKTIYGTVELTDGANQSAIETIGRLRANAPAVQNAIQGLEDDSLSSAPEMNTEVAVLNKINAGELIGVRTAQDTNKLLVAVAEGQLITAKRTRDAEARAIVQHARFLAEGKALLTAQAAGTSAAMQAWRMP